MELEHRVRQVGQQQIAYGYGFEPGESVSATMYSVPQDLGTQIANADGEVVFTWAVDSEAVVGQHRVELVGVLSGAVDDTFQVVARSSLAATGADLGSLIPFGLLILIAGPALTIATRRDGVASHDA